MAFIPAEPPVEIYGMEDCDRFLDIPPLVHWPDGSSCINPDFDNVRKFHLFAKAQSPTAPTAGFVTAVTIAAGATVDFQLTVDREENGMGHLLVNELLMLTNPASSDQFLRVSMKSPQADKSYTHVPVPAHHVFGNSHLNCCLPCPIMIFPSQTVIISVTNEDTNPVTVQVVARGKRFMPYNNMRLRDEMERCWMQIPSIPFWSSLDQRVLIPAGGTAQGQFTVPGGSFFEVRYIRAQVVPAAGNSTAENVLLSVTDGRIGPRLMNQAVPLSTYATETRAVTGFPGDFFRAASACHCPAPEMLLRGNTRVIHNFRNLDTANDLTVDLTYVGCLHFASRCPPGAVLDAVRDSAGVFDSPMIGTSGWGAYEDGSYEGGIFAPDWGCEPTYDCPPMSGLAGRPQGEWEKI